MLAAVHHRSHPSHFRIAPAPPLNSTYDSDNDEDQDMQVDSDSDAKRDADADADGEYVDDDTTVMAVDVPAAGRPSSYPRSSVRPRPSVLDCWSMLTKLTAIPGWRRFSRYLLLCAWPHLIAMTQGYEDEDDDDDNDEDGSYAEASYQKKKARRKKKQPLASSSTVRPKGIYRR
jgi:hypothetical protein